MNTKIDMKHVILLTLALIFASTISVFMLVIRYFYSDHVQFTFLLWNLFLAWLPFLLAVIVIMFPVKHYVTYFFGGLWLLFFPNAPYIVTDLLHLRPYHSVPFWYDMILLLSFALTGLGLGLASLGLMQSWATRRFGRMGGWLFVLVALLCAGFGVYIGRFLRWNSWDLFSNPLLLWQDLHLTLTTPYLFVKTAVITSALTAVFTFSYLLFTLLPQLVVIPSAYSGD
ncbi:MAG: DUF1361 domain-containing protein [Chloroflexi bacterium]|nr:DUF1361 domain-containing protein [Chloroflexota bacterium]